MVYKLAKLLNGTLTAVQYVAQRALLPDCFLFPLLKHSNLRTPFFWLTTLNYWAIGSRNFKSLDVRGLYTQVKA
jgi:hypothetical protein